MDPTPPCGSHTLCPHKLRDPNIGLHLVTPRRQGQCFSQKSAGKAQCVATIQEMSSQIRVAPEHFAAASAMRGSYVVRLHGCGVAGWRSGHALLKSTQLLWLGQQASPMLWHGRGTVWVSSLRPCGTGRCGAARRRSVSRVGGGSGVTLRLSLSGGPPRCVKSKYIWHGAFRFSSSRHSPSFCANPWKSGSELDTERK